MVTFDRLIGALFFALLLAILLEGCGVFPTYDQARIDTAMGSSLCFVTGFGQEIRAETSDLCPVVAVAPRGKIERAARADDWDAEWARLQYRLGIAGEDTAAHALYQSVVIYTDGKPPCEPTLTGKPWACTTPAGVYITGGTRSLHLGWTEPGDLRIWAHEACHVFLAIYGKRTTHDYVERQQVNAFGGTRRYWTVSDRDRAFYEGICQDIGSTQERAQLSDPSRQYP